MNSRLRELLERYTELHPDVRALQRAIDARGSCDAAPPAAEANPSGEQPGSEVQPAPPAGAGVPEERSPAARRSAGPAESTQVTIDAGMTYQVMAGFGASNRLWDDPHVSNASSTVIPPAAQREILTRLYKDLGFTRVRPNLDGGIEPVNDNADPFTTDLSKFDFRGRRNDDHVAFVRQAIPFGLRTFWPVPLRYEAWMTAADIDEYVEWSMAVLLRWRKLGLEVPFYSLINEPGNPDLRKFNLSADWMLEFVKRLGRRMRAEGLRTMLVVPDDINPTEAYKRIVPLLADPEARQYIGALAYHLYGDVRYKSEIRDLARKYKIPVWMSEFSSRDYVTYSGALRWARTIHQLITEDGVSAVDYMWGYFGSWAGQGADSLVNVEFDNGVYRGYKLSPAYHLTGQYSRFVRPGYVRIDAQSRLPGILVSAFKGPSEIVVVAINYTQVPRPVELSISGIGALQPVAATRTSPTERWEALPAIAPDGPRFSGLLPAESVTTFVARSTDASSER